MEVGIRRATPGDASAASEVLVRSRHHAVPAIPPLVHSDDEVHAWFAGVVMREREVWVADTSDGTLVGVMVLDGRSVDQLYLEPGWTGRGIGARLLDQAKSRSPGGLVLWAFVSNLAARRFYEREGFVEVEQTDGSGNKERAPDVRYEWSP